MNVEDKKKAQDLGLSAPRGWEAVAVKDAADLKVFEKFVAWPDSPARTVTEAGAVAGFPARHTGCYGKPVHTEFSAMYPGSAFVTGAVLAVRRKGLLPVTCDLWAMVEQRVNETVDDHGEGPSLAWVRETVSECLEAMGVDASEVEMQRLTFDDDCTDAFEDVMVEIDDHAMPVILRRIKQLRLKPGQFIAANGEVLGDI